MANSNNHGGRRPGAGRPKKPKPITLTRADGSVVNSLDFNALLGRPFKIADIETFYRLLFDYIRYCSQTGEPMLQTGLVNALGLTSWQQLLGYRKRGEEWVDAVNKAILVIAMFYEDGAVKGTIHQGFAEARLKALGYGEARINALMNPDFLSHEERLKYLDGGELADMDPADRLAHLR